MALGLYTTFTLDMVPGGAPPIIHVSAEDVGRKYTANLTYNGEPYDIQGNRLTIAGTKPDGTVFEYPVDDFEQNESWVDFLIKEQMAIVPGTVRCKLREYLNDDQIGSATFIMDVDEYVYDPEAASESYIPTYETAIQEALETVADDIADLATAAAINDVKQYSDAASASATAAAESAASAAESAENAFSGTPEGYNTLVASVGELTGNDGNFAIQAFPKATINSAVDLNTIYIGDYACKDTSYLTNAPTGLTVPVRITVFARTRDGLTDPDALSNTMHRTQTIVDAAGKEYRRQMKRLGGGTITWTDWQLYTLNSYVTTTVTLNSDYFDTSSESEDTKCVFMRSGNVVIAVIRNAILQTAPTRWQTIVNIPTGYKPVRYEYVGMKVGASDVANKSEFMIFLGETKMQFFGGLSVTSDTHVSLKVVYITTDAMPTA